MKKSIQKLLGVVLAAAITIVTAGAVWTSDAVDVQADTVLRVANAVIQGNNVVVTTSGTATSDDGILYLYAQEVYEAGALGTVVGKAPSGAVNPTFTFTLNKYQANSNLTKKFAVMANKGGVITQVSQNACYITNPEASTNRAPARRDGGKKGILPAAETIGNTAELQQLGIKQIVYNLPIGNLVSSGGVPFTYNGKNYQFSSAIVGQYDQIVPKMNAAGIQVTLILLNNLTKNQTLIHPRSRGLVGNYYAFNTSDMAGTELLEAIAAFLGSRYAGQVGVVDNWIVGNEFNAPNPWHLMNADIDTHTMAYAQALRIFYNGIKSENKNARVYACIDQEWAYPDSALHYAGKTCLEKLNNIMINEGNVDWGVAAHPYNYPLYDSNTISMRLKAPVSHTQLSRYITMENIDVLTDFLCQPALKAPNGQVRSVLLSEQGYTSTAGEQLQAAAIVHAYAQANANQHIDGFILNRQLDHQVEVAQGLATGIKNPNGTHKLAFSWYQNADSPAIQTQAAAVFGATSMAQLLTVR